MSAERLGLVLVGEARARNQNCSEPDFFCASCIQLLVKKDQWRFCAAKVELYTHNDVMTKITQQLIKAR